MQQPEIQFTGTLPNKMKIFIKRLKGNKSPCQAQYYRKAKNVWPTENAISVQLKKHAKCDIVTMALWFNLKTKYPA